MEQTGITREQADELLEIIWRMHGYDFRDYAYSSLMRRITHVLHKYRLDVFSLKQHLLNDEPFFRSFLDELTVNVTEMFRDPEFYASVSTHVLPYLASYPHIKLWNAGCSSGEETYSFAVLLKEAGLYSKSFLYGTDINAQVLQQARDGIYELSKLRAYSGNYREAMEHGSLADHYYAAYDAGIMNEALKKNMLFSVHNLVMDKPFNTFQLIACRNVLIYFNSRLQKKVLELLYESLCPLGFLCLGARETIRDRKLLSGFRVIDARNCIYQKTG